MSPWGKSYSSHNFSINSMFIIFYSSISPAGGGLFVWWGICQGGGGETPEHEEEYGSSTSPSVNAEF